MTWSVKSFLDTGCIDERWGAASKCRYNDDTSIHHLMIKMKSLNCDLVFDSLMKNPQRI